MRPGGRLSPRLRHRLLLVAVPVLVGLTGTAAALAYPHTVIPGTMRTGPHGLDGVRSVVLDFHPSVSWGPGRRDVILTLRPRRPCTVHVSAVTSTQPGRIEVHAQETGRDCVGRRRTERVALPLPTLPDPRRNVRVDVGPESLHVPWARTPKHPPGSLDA